MTFFQIKLADTVISVECLYASTKAFCADYFSDSEKVDFSVSINPADIKFEREKSDKERELEGLPPYAPPSEYLETLALYRKITEKIIDYNIILFHGSALALDGKAYIFTAKSGTGKSTHTRLWREAFGDRVVMINDDKPLIKVTDSGSVVYGTPWCGKHNLGVNSSAPLYAIVSLDRSPVNKITGSDPRTMLPKIISQTYRTNNPAGLQKTLVLIDKMLKNANLFELFCNMDPEAATVAYNGMKGD